MAREREAALHQSRADLRHRRPLDRQVRARPVARAQRPQEEPRKGRHMSEFVYVTYIYTTAQQVWDAITKPEFARRYWRHTNVSDWKPGSRGEPRHGDGSGKVLIDGEVLEANPPHRLVMTWTR